MNDDAGADGVDGQNTRNIMSGGDAQLEGKNSNPVNGKKAHGVEVGIAAVVKQIVGINHSANRWDCR